MKKLTLFIFAGIVLSCNSGQTNATDAGKDTSSASTNYPYTIDHPDYWEMGSTANTMIALSSLKAWEEGKIDESLKYFGDSVHMEFDGLDKKMSNDSVKAMLGNAFNGFNSVHIKMNDWESVISKDKAEEWVTIWYSQHWETKAGVKDSAAIVNDFQMKDGKIIRLSEYTRKL